MTFQQQKEVFDDLGTFVSANLISRNTKNGAKPYIEVLYNPKLSGDKTHTGEPYKRGAFQDSLRGSKNTLSSLREGDPVTLKVVLNGKFKNLVGIEAGHTAIPNRSPSASRAAATTNNSTSSGGDYNTRAANGQAANMALAIAISEGKAHDLAYIKSLKPHTTAIGEFYQNGDTQLGTSTTTNGLQGSTTGVQQAATSTQSSIGGQQVGIPTNGSTQTEVDTAITDLFGGI